MGGVDTIVRSGAADVTVSCAMVLPGSTAKRDRRLDGSNSIRDMDRQNGSRYPSCMLGM